MPKKKTTATAVDRDTLVQIKQSGVESTVLDCRLEYADAAQLRNHFIAPMENHNRVYPNFLPTQASGRWSMTGLYRANFPNNCINPDCTKPKPHMVGHGECWSTRNVVWPDPGTYWLHFDLDAIEAKLVAAYSEDRRDIEAFNLSHDIHTLTACRTYGIAEPPIKTKACHTVPECEEWRQSWKPVWEGGDDLRRRLNKVLRFGLAYGPNETAILNAKGVEELGLSRDELLAAGRTYLKSKPELAAWKKRMWQTALEKRETRTFLGRRRKLFVTRKDLEMWYKRHMPPECVREGLNHIIQGSVADMMNKILIDIVTEWPDVTLAQHLHDGLVLVFPKIVKCWPRVKEIVEQTWQVTPSVSIVSTGEFEIIRSDGRKEPLK